MSRSRRLQVELAYIRQSKTKKLAGWDKMLGEIRHKCIRDFLAVEAPFKNENIPSVIIHIPSGHWQGLTLSYEQTVWKLEHPSETDDSLTQWICN